MQPANGRLTCLLALVVGVFPVLAASCGGDVPPVGGGSGGKASAGAAGGAAGEAPDADGGTGSGTGGTGPCPDGEETCSCYGNLTCNAGLVCLSHLCVSLGVGPGTGGTVSATGGSSPGGTGGAAGSGVGGAGDGGGSSVGAGGVEAMGGADPGAGGSPDGGASGGGTRGDGGSATCGPSCGDGSVIDDFDDGDHVACSRAGWDSGWWLATDGTGTLAAPAGGDAAGLPAPLSPARGTSCGGLHVQGSGFSSWGVNLGLTFNNPDDTVPREVSLSGSSGISFWARGSGSVGFILSTSDIDPPENGGSCAQACKQYFKPAGDFELSGSWQKFSVTFSTLYSGTLGRTLSAADLDKVLFIGLTPQSSAAFDFWLDDVELTP